jgi:hypothetical protein
MLGGNRNNGSLCGSRCANWNNYPRNSNWNIGARAACDDLCYRVRTAKALRTDQGKWSASSVLLRRIPEVWIMGSSVSETHTSVCLHG